MYVPFCLLEAIKNWRWERPANEAIMSGSNGRLEPNKIPRGNASRDVTKCVHVRGGVIKYP